MEISISSSAGIGFNTVSVLLSRLVPMRSVSTQSLGPHAIRTISQVVSALPGTMVTVTGPPVPKILAPNPGAGCAGTRAKSCGAAIRPRRPPIAAARHPPWALNVSGLILSSFRGRIPIAQSGCQGKEERKESEKCLNLQGVIPVDRLRFLNGRIRRPWYSDLIFGNVTIYLVSCLAAATATVNTD